MSQYQELIKKVIVTIFSDVAISQPLYCPDIKTESDGEKLSNKLPLIYIWNEEPNIGTFSISVNGPIVGETLECYLPRTDPSFVQVRDEVMETIRKLAINSVTNTCEKAGLLPSVAFSREVYLEMINAENKDQVIYDEDIQHNLQPSNRVKWFWILLFVVFCIALIRNFVHFFLY